MPTTTKRRDKFFALFTSKNLARLLAWVRVKKKKKRQIALERGWVGSCRKVISQSQRKKVAIAKKQKSTKVKVKK